MANPKERTRAEMSLFEDAYTGRALIVCADTHELMKELFPELDAHSEYRDADSWLVACPRRKVPRNTKRFLLNWFRKSKRAALREVSRQDLVARELRVGGGPW
jgi:hypothetical protein